jgi:hypothetical protein
MTAESWVRVHCDGNQYPHIFETKRTKGGRVFCDGWLEVQTASTVQARAMLKEQKGWRSTRLPNGQQVDYCPAHVDVRRVQR